MSLYSWEYFLRLCPVSLCVFTFSTFLSWLVYFRVCIERKVQGPLLAQSVLTPQASFQHCAWMTVTPTSCFPSSVLGVCVCVGKLTLHSLVSLHLNTIKPDTWTSVMVVYHLYIFWLSQQENPSKVSWAFLECGWPRGPHLGMVWKILIGWLVHPCWSTTRNIFSHILMYPAWFILVFNYNLSF